MNLFVDSRYAESVQRLAIGIECTDPMMRMRIGRGLHVTHDGVPTPVPGHRRDRAANPWIDQNVLQVITRRNSGRHVVLMKSGVADPFAIRLDDPAQRFAPRRLRIRLEEPLVTGRRIRPALFPGAAYPIPAGAVGVRGRVVRGGVPMRWGRVEAHRIGDGVLVGRGHGDQHGEFVLLLDSGASRGADLILPLEIRVTVYGPDPAPDADDFPASAIDPLWDLPVEEVALDASGEAVLSGAQLPSGYVSRPGTVRDVEFSWFGPVREEFDFS